MKKNTRKTIMVISIILISSLFFLGSSFAKKDHPNKEFYCLSGCYSDLDFYLRPLALFSDEIEKKSGKAETDPADLLLSSQLCPAVCFTPKHPLSYLLYDLSGLASIGLVIFLLIARKSRDRNGNSETDFLNNV